MNLLILVGCFFTTFALAKFFAIFWAPQGEKPSVTNNWRRERSGSDASSFHESGAGMKGGDGGGL